MVVPSNINSNGLNENVKFSSDRSVSVDYPISDYVFRKKYLPKGYKYPIKYRSTFVGKYGIINYQLYGKKEYPIILFFHGMNASMETFNNIAEILKTLDLCLITFDLYGHGLSQQPRNNNLHQSLPLIDKVFKKPKYHSTDFYIFQANELLQHLGLNERNINVVGFSLGGVLASRFTELNSDKVDHLILISSAGVIKDKKKKRMVSLLRMFQFCIPCVPVIFRPALYRRETIIDNLKQQGLNDESANYLYNYQFWQLFVRKGTIQATLGSVVGVPLINATKIFKKVNQSNVPVLVICGSKDKVIPVEASKMVASHFENSHLIVFPQACHLIVMKRKFSLPLSALICTFIQVPKDCTKKEWSSLLPIDAMGKKVTLDDNHKKLAQKLNVNLNVAECLLSAQNSIKPLLKIF